MATHQLLVGGAAVGVDSGNAMDRCPAWMHDADRLRRGRTFFERHMAAVMFALHSSVLLQFAFDGLRRSAAKMTMGQRVMGHGSSGSTNLSVSRGSRASTRDPLTHDQVNKIPRTGYLVAVMMFDFESTFT